MILLTGATGTVGSALLARLLARDAQVRCLVRDPRRLGPARVRVQIALGDLADPASFRHALRGVSTVVHLAAAIRNRPRASIEEVNAVATMRLLRAAERSGAERFVYFSALGASLHSRTAFMRAKALAERAVEASPLRTAVFAPSIVYAPGDPWLRLLERLSHLPLVPIPGPGTALFQPIWAEDVAGCVMPVLSGEGAGDAAHARHELAGPETLSHAQIVRAVLRSLGRRRPLVHVPLPAVRRGLTVLELMLGQSAFATWDEAELLEVPMTTPRGTADAEALGIAPRPIHDVLGS